MNKKILKDSVLTAFCLTVFASLAATAFAGTININRGIGDYFWNSGASLSIVHADTEPYDILVGSSSGSTSAWIWAPGTFTEAANDVSINTAQATAWVAGHYGWFDQGWNAYSYVNVDPLASTGVADYY